MSLFCCETKCKCLVAAIIASVVLGVLATFFQITAVITVTPVFLWVVFGIAMVYLGVLVIAAALTQPPEMDGCFCETLNALLAGVLGSILFAVVLLAVGIVATSVVSAIFVGVLVFFFALALTATACFVRKLTACRV